MNIFQQEESLYSFQVLAVPAALENSSRDDAFFFLLNFAPLDKAEKIASILTADRAPTQPSRQHESRRTTQA